MNYSDFEPLVNQHFEVLPPNENPQQLLLVRAGTLPPPPPGYPEVRQQPFELIFRSFTTTVLPDELLTLTTPEGTSYNLTLQAECSYTDEKTQLAGIQYHCLFS